MASASLSFDLELRDLGVLGADVLWDCPDVMWCGFQRHFRTLAQAEAFVEKLKTRGCPASPWFPEERP